MQLQIYKDIRKYWVYIHPYTRLLILVDYSVEQLMEKFSKISRRIISEKNLKYYYWIPRFTGLVFVLFLSSLAFDSITGYKSFYLMINSALAKLVPSLVLAIMLIIAWKEELLGGILFMLLFLVLFALIVSESPLLSDLIFYGPIFIIGLFFLIDYYLRQIYKKSPG